MSQETYTNGYPAGDKFSNQSWYSQAVVLGDLVKCSGQGGWDPCTGDITEGDFSGQMERAMDNVDLVLRSVGLQGWEDVAMVRSYHVQMDKFFPIYVDLLKKRIPGHKPASSALGVPSLAYPNMLIELEVEARRHKQ